MNNPTVSVAMIVCNVDRFLAQAIESVLDQTFRDFEFNIVDFGSTDTTKDIVASYAAKDKRIRLHEVPHCGLAKARNASCLLARGRYIAIQDADDLSLPDRLAKEVEFMERNPEVGLLGGAVEWIDAQGNPKPSLAHDYPTEHAAILVALTKYCPFWQPTVLIRKDAFTRAGGYRVGFEPSEDYDLWLRISEQFKCANLNQALVRYRIHPQQASFKKRTQQILGFLGAQASARLRSAGVSDPLNTGEVITPSILMQMGVTQAEQQAALAQGYQHWIKYMYLAGEEEAALSAAREMLGSADWKHANPHHVADVYILTATAHWRHKRYFRSAVAMGGAVKTRPRILGRPLRWMWNRVTSFQSAQGDLK